MARARRKVDPNNPKAYFSYFRVSLAMEEALAKMSVGVMTRSDIARCCINHVLSLPVEEQKEIFYKGATRAVL